MFNKNRRGFMRKSLLLLLLSCTFTASLATFPRIINYQGKLTNPDGVALNGTHDIVFRIYDVSAGGTPLWAEEHTTTNGHPVNVNNGLFDVHLGEITPLSIAFDDTYWIELEVDGEVLSPREMLVLVPYAFRAIVADTAHYIPDLPSGDNDYIQNQNSSAQSANYWINGTGHLGNNLYVDGRLGVGTTSPTEKVDVSTSASTHDGVSVQNTNANGAAEYVALNNDNAGIVLGMSGTSYSYGAGIAYYLAMRNGGTLNKIVYGAYDTSVPIEFWQNSSEVVVIDTNGNVGIGTSSAPSHKLDVNGTGRITGTLTIGAYTLPNTDGSSGQVLTTDGSGNVNWQNVPGDNWGTQVVQTTARLSGDGTSTNPLDIAQMGATSGEILKWNGSSWAPAADDTGTNYWTLSGSNLSPNSTTWNVGIGTTTPSVKLDVNGKARVGTGTNLSPSSSGDGYLMFKGSGYTGFITLDGNAMYVGHNSDLRRLDFMTNETSRLTITGGGSVGIGTTSPGAKLDVANGGIRASATGPIFLIRNSTSGHQWEWYSGGSVGNDAIAIFDRTNSAYRFVINNSGNIGIGTTSPASKLDVNGTIRAAHYKDSSGGNLLRSSNGTINISEDSDGSWDITTATTIAHRQSISTGTGGGTQTLDIPHYTPVIITAADVYTGPKWIGFVHLVENDNRLVWVGYKNDNGTMSQVYGTGYVGSSSDTLTLFTLNGGATEVKVTYVSWHQTKVILHSIHDSKLLMYW